MPRCSCLDNQIQDLESIQDKESTKQSPLNIQGGLVPRLPPPFVDTEIQQQSSPIYTMVYYLHTSYLSSCILYIISRLLLIRNTMQMLCKKLPRDIHVLLFGTLYLFIFWSHHIWDLSSPMDQIHFPLQWKCRILITGLPGKSQGTFWIF